MSLLHTAELNGVNPFDYLCALFRHADVVEANPDGWLPWNDTQALKSSSVAPGSESGEAQMVSG